MFVVDNVQNLFGEEAQQGGTAKLRKEFWALECVDADDPYAALKRDRSNLPSAKARGKELHWIGWGSTNPVANPIE